MNLFTNYLLIFLEESACILFASGV